MPDFINRTNCSFDYSNLSKPVLSRQDLWKLTSCVNSAVSMSHSCQVSSKDLKVVCGFMHETCQNGFLVFLCVEFEKTRLASCFWCRQNVSSFSVYHHYHIGNMYKRTLFIVYASPKDIGDIFKLQMFLPLEERLSIKSGTRKSVCFILSIRLEGPTINCWFKWP